MFRKAKYSTKTFSVETDISEALSYLESLGANRHKSMRRILSSIGVASKNEVKKAYKSWALSKRSGSLYKSIRSKVIRSGKAVVIDASAHSQTNKVFYGYSLAKGALIEAKANKYLTFQIDGKWKKVHSVQLPERDFVVTPVKKYLATTAFKQKLDQIVQREINRLEKDKTK
jgi:hypothetical protein